MEEDISKKLFPYICLLHKILPGSVYSFVGKKIRKVYVHSFTFESGAKIIISSSDFEVRENFKWRVYGANRKLMAACRIGKIHSSHNSLFLMIQNTQISSCGNCIYGR